jgi:hypothetical protein
MKNKLTFFVVILICVNSCNIKQEGINDRINTEENELIGQLFCELVKPFSEPPLPENGLKNIQKGRIYNVDTTRYKVDLDDSLFIPDIHDFQNIRLPIEFQELINNWSDGSLKPRKLKVDSMKVKCDYEIITEFKNDSTLQEKIMYQNLIGIVRFSRISFNADFSKACFFQSISRGRNSGIGYLITNGL